MAREDQGIGNDDVLAATSGEDDNLGNIVASQRLDTPGSYWSALLGEVPIAVNEGNLLVDGIGLRLVAVESHNGELLTWS